MSTKNQLIIAVGDLVWDAVVRPDTPLLPGGDTTGHIALLPGGSAANFAVWAARVGAQSGFVGSVGTDFFGDAIARDLEQEGVQSWLTRTSERNTGVVLVLLDNTGQRSMITNQGADFVLRPEDLPYEILCQSKHVHLTAWSLFTDPPRAAALRAAQIASASGASVSLDPASFQMINEIGRDRFLEMLNGLRIDILLPNRDEAQALTGAQEPEAMAEMLQAQFPGAIIALKLDDAGCYILGQDARYHVPAVPVAAIDATGAGDAFDGVFVSHYLATGDLVQAAQRANAAGAWVVTHTGARPPIDKTLQTALDLHD